MGNVLSFVRSVEITLLTYKLMALLKTFKRCIQNEYTKQNGGWNYENRNGYNR